MMITEEQKIMNLSLWVKGLNMSGVNTDCIIDKYGNDLRNAPLSDNVSTGIAYEGALIHKSFRFCKLAKGINALIEDESIRLDNKIITKVCLLANMGKCTMFKLCTEKWKIERGILYEYADTNTAMRTNQRTLFMLNNCGIQLTEEEYEAIDNLYILKDDRYVEDFSGLLASIIRLAYKMMMEESKSKYKLGVKNGDMF
jgi:hypothetical protein